MLKDGCSLDLHSKSALSIQASQVQWYRHALIPDVSHDVVVSGVQHELSEALKLDVLGLCEELRLCSAGLVC